MKVREKGSEKGSEKMRDGRNNNREKQQAGVLSSIPTLLRRMEDCVLVLLLLLMICMAVTQIFLRNLFDGGIFWGDVLVRILVLWIGLFGAMIASRQNRHINIDIITRYLSKQAGIVAGLITNLFTAVICLIVAWHSFQFVRMEFEDGGIAFARVPVWVCEAIIPFAFIVIGTRYLFLAADVLLHGNDSPGSEGDSK